MDNMNLKKQISETTQKFLWDLRKTQRITQSELAVKLGVCPSLVSSNESGSRSPSLSFLVKLADYAQVSVDYLLGREGSFKFKLTGAEEHLIEAYRKTPLGCELKVTIGSQGDFYIEAKQEVTL